MSNKVFVAVGLAVVAVGAMMLCVVGFFVFTHTKTLCLVGSNASVTTDGPMSFTVEEDQEHNMVQCEEPRHIPIICVIDAGVATKVRVRDRGLLGITIEGTRLCEEYRQRMERTGR